MAKMTRTACVISVVLFISLFTLPSAFPQIYRWTDEKGTIHFSDNPSSLPKDYSVAKKRNAEKKEAENKPSVQEEKPKSETKPATPPDKSKLEKEAILPADKAKPADKRDESPTQPTAPVKPAIPDKVIVQIKPAEENVIKPTPPAGPAPTPGTLEMKKGPEMLPGVPGDLVNSVRMKPTMKVGAFVGILGFVLSAVGGIWFLVAAFKVSAKWGLLCLFLAPAQLVFLFKHWKEARKPFAVGLLAMGVILVAIFLMVEEPFLLLSQYGQFK